MLRKGLFLAIVLFVVAIRVCPGYAAWPERPVTMIVPFNPGGDTDFMGRIYSKLLQEELGQPVVVVNMAGAGGTVGAQHVADAANDGYTFLFYHTGNLYPNKMRGVTTLDHHAYEIVCIAGADDTNVLVAGKKAGFKDTADFLEKVRSADKGTYSAAVTASGYSCYILSNMEVGGNFSVNIVDCGGAADSIPMILGKQVDLGVATYGVYKQYIDNGSMIPLIAAGAERNANFSDVPTARELGFTTTIVDRYYFVAFPKGTDTGVIQKLASAIKNVQSKQVYADEIAKGYYLKPFFVDHDKAADFLENVWKQMEPFTDAMNRARK